MCPAITCVVGARPNYPKAAPVARALRNLGVTVRVVDTGQHYDPVLSSHLAAILDIGVDARLQVGSGSHGKQTAKVLVRVERELTTNPPEAVVVFGDVNSTLGAALAAAKLNIPIVHVESGLRSCDHSMPEEINRIVVDRIAALRLCSCEDAQRNLTGENLSSVVVGNTMIDSLLNVLPVAPAPGDHVLVTLHRPALVDHPERLAAVMTVLAGVGVPVILPVHPRTRATLTHVPESITVRDPLEYREFVELEASARLVVTDSGGVQEETSWLGVPCLTYRNETERPVTVTNGTNRVVGLDPNGLAAAIWETLRAPRPVRPMIPFWDGHAGERAAAAIVGWLDA